MRIVFFGTPSSCLPIVKKIYSRFDLALIISKSSILSLSRRKRNESKLEAFSNYESIDYLTPKSFDSSFIQNLYSMQPDIFVVCAYGRILNKKVLSIPKFGTINIHPSLLPQYRGPSPVQYSIKNLDVHTGFTFIKMDEGIDTGDIILQETYPIKDSDDYSTLLQVAHVECANVLYSAINLIKSQSFSTIKQKDIHPVGLYCSKRKSGDEILDWNQTSREVFNFIRAICKPGPMSRSYVNGKEIKINKAEIVKNTPKYKSTVGLVLEKDDKGIYVKTSDSFVRLTEYEYDGKLRVGDKLESK